MKRLIAGLLVAVLSVASAQEKIKSYKWTPIPNAILSSGKIYIDINSININKADSGEVFNTASLLMVYDEPLSVHLKSGETKTGISVVSNVVIDCATGVGAPINDFLVADKMPTKKSIPVASKMYKITPEIMFHLSKDDPIRIALCPEEI